MAPIADLQVAVQLVGEDLASGAIRSAQQALGGFGNTLAEVGKTAAGFVLGNIIQDVGGGLSGAFEKGVSEAQSFGQATLGLQRIIGGTAEQVSGMMAALERFGLTQEDASRSLGIFSRNIEAFENGSAKADASGKGFAGAVNSLGLSLKDATGATLPMNDLMLQVADKFRAMPDGVEKTADAMALFGRSGKDMILFLNQGSEGLQEAMDAAQKYGLTLTGENLEAVRQFGLAHKDLDETMQGLTLQLGLAFMPALNALATSAVGLAQAFNTNVMPSIQALGPVIATAIDWVGGGLGTAFDTLGHAITGVQGFIAAFTTDAGGMGIVLDQVRAIFGNTVADAIEPFVQAFMRAIPSIKELASAIGSDLSNPMGTLTTLWANLQSVMEPFAPTADRISALIGNITSAIAGMVPSPLEDLVTNLLTMGSNMGTAATAGGGFRDALQGVANVINSVTQFINDHVAAQAALIGVLGGAAAVLGLVTAAAIAHAVATTGVAVATGVWKDAQWLLNAALTANPIGIVVVALAALAAGLIYAYNNSETFRNAVNDLATDAAAAFDVLGTAAHAVLDWLAGVLPAIGDAFSQLGSGVQAALSAIGDVFSQLGTDVQTELSTIGDTFSQFGSTVQEALDAVGATVGDFFSNLGSAVLAGVSVIRGFFDDTWNAIPDDVRTDLVEVISLIGDHFSRLGSMVQSGMTAVRDAIQTGWTAATIAVGEAMSAIGSTVRAGWDIVSAAVGAAMIAIGTVVSARWAAITSAVGDAMSAVGTAVNAGWTVITAEVGTAMSDIGTAVQKGWDVVSSATSTAWDAASSAITGVLNTITSAISGWIADVLAKIKGMAGDLGTAGEQAGQAIIDGITGAVRRGISAVGDELHSLALGALEAAKKTLESGSPSQLFAREVGIPIVEGIAEGIRSQQDAVTTAVTTTVGTALTRNTDLTDIIKQTATKYGIDASTAIRVAMSEGGVTPGAVGDRGTSFGPFQLHTGGGLGDSFKSLTGLDPADIQTTIQQIDFALSNAAAHGWSAWHGAARVGISDWQGIGGVITETIPTVANAGAATAQAIADGINSKDPAVRAAAQEAARQAAIAVSEAAPVNTFIVAGQDMGDGLNLGLLRGVDKAKAAADTWGDSILTSMQSFTQGVNTEVQNTTTKLADIATAAGNAVQTALTTESTAIDAAAQRASDSIAKLVGQANITADTSSRTSALQAQISAETAAHNAIAAADEADYQHKLQLSNAAAKLATELGNATTAAQKASLQQQYESQVANINQSFAAQQAATAHKQQLDKAAADFKASEDAKMAQLTQTLADEAMGRQIADAIKTQVATSLAAQQTYTDAVSKAQATADAQRQILLSSYTQRINDLKTAFLDKIPPLEGPALDAFNAFMDNINSKTEALGLSVAGSMGAVTAAVQKTLGVPGGSGDVPDAIGITDQAVETFADKWQVSWDDARATLLAGGAAAKEQMGNGGVIPTAARQAADSLNDVKTAAGPTLQSTLDTLEKAAQGLGEHGFAVAHDAAADLEGQFPGLTAAVDAWIATLGKIPTSITTTVNTNFTTNGSAGGGGGAGGGAGSRNLGSTAGTPGSFTLPNIQTGGTITVQASNLGDAITRAAQQTGVSAAAQAGGGTFGSGTNPGLAIGGITTRDVTADLHANEAVIPLERLNQIMGMPAAGGSYTRLHPDDIRAIAAAVTGVNLSVSVDDLHLGLLRKQRSNGTLGFKAS